MSQNTATSSRRLVLAALVCSMLAGCANLIGPRQVDVPLSKLQAGIDKRFPINNRIMALLDLQLTHPQLALVPESNRLSLTMDATLAPPLTDKSWSGSFQLSGMLAIDAGKNTIVLRDVVLDRVLIDGSDSKRQEQFAKVANVAASRLLKDVPLHTFNPEQLRYGGVQFTPTRITATGSGVQVTFEPVR